MKKTLLLLVALISLGLAQAQNCNWQNNLAATDSPTFTFGGWYSDGLTSFAERIQNSDTLTLDSIAFMPSNQGAAGAITLAIYTEANGLPGTMLHQQTMTTWTSNALNKVALTTPVVVAGNYFVVLEVNDDDTYLFTTHERAPSSSYALYGTDWYSVYDIFEATVSFYLYAHGCGPDLADSTFTITVLANDDAWGTVTGTGSYQSGDTVTLTATPAEGYRFSHWQDGETANPRQVIATGNLTFTAIFAPEIEGGDSISVLVLSTNPDWGSVEGSGTYEANSPVTITATPHQGYHFVKWHLFWSEVEDDFSEDMEAMILDNPFTLHFDLDLMATAIFAEDSLPYVDTLFTLPYRCGFETARDLSYWRNLDRDDDGYRWTQEQTTIYYDYQYIAPEGEYFMASASWASDFFGWDGDALTPDNWLISPAIQVPEGGATLSFQVGVGEYMYPAEHYKVLLSTTASTDAASFTQTLHEETLTEEAYGMVQRTVALPAGTLRIAFVHTGCENEGFLLLDDIRVSAANGVLTPDGEAQVLAVEYYDLLGRRLSQEPARGVYLIRTITTQGSSTQKVVK